MEKRQIVNIINFIRGCEPRCQVDLVKPVREQLALLANYDFAGTFLFQYDALCDSSFTDLLEDVDPKIEVGVWLEIVEPLCQAAGIPWRGRFPWDWHAHVGFSVGYTLEERERLIDCLFAKFKEIFGYYPASMGSWIIDAHSLAYAQEKYGLRASCNCKDQWGTDGYTLWGAYYNGAYYPSRRNAFSPAQTEEGQIPLPIFRMLGSDPIRQYDMGLDPSAGAAGVQGVITLEPVYTSRAGGGGNPSWVDWFLGEVYSGCCLTYAYTQAGQENSFGWEAMEGGLIHQFARFKELSDAGKLTVETLRDSADYFIRTYPLTPAATLCAFEPWEGDTRQTVWYCSRYYRINWMVEDGGLRIRDLYLFREDYAERYWEEVCKTPYLQFDTLPFIDGNRFSGHGILSGGRFEKGGKPFAIEAMDYSEEGECAILRFGSAEEELTARLFPDRIEIAAKGELALRITADTHAKGQPQRTVENDRIRLCHRGFEYTIGIGCGRSEEMGNDLLLTSRNGKLVLELNQ